MMKRIAIFQCLTKFLVIMNKLDKMISLMLIKIVLVLSCVAFSVLSVAFGGINVGGAIAFVAIVLTVIALDSVRK